jgi:[ribosomal protein S5]-alanine N-acetyltransferase
MTIEIFKEFSAIDINDEIFLRQITRNDIASFYQYISKPEVTKFLSDPEIPNNLNEAETELMYWADLFLKRRSIYWAVAKKENNELIGTAGFNSWSQYHRRAEISYDLSHLYWGRGVMTSVIKKITDFAFKHMQVNRIQATVLHYNVGSLRVLEKCNYIREGRLINYGILHGKEEDFFMCAITR